MSHSSTEQVRDTLVTTATGFSLDSGTKTDSRGGKTESKTGSKSKTESGSKTEVKVNTKEELGLRTDSKTGSKSKTESGSKTEVKVDSKEEPGTKTDSKTKSKTQSRTQSESANKVESVGINLENKTAGTKTASKSASASKEAVMAVHKASGESAASGTTKKASQESSGKPETESTSKKATESSSKPVDLKNQRAGPSSSYTKTKSESVSKPESLTNRLQGSGSPAESANNVHVASLTSAPGSSGSKSATTAASTAAATRRGSSDSGGSHDLESANNPETKPATPEKAAAAPPPAAGGESAESTEAKDKAAGGGKGGKERESMASNMAQMNEDVNPFILPFKNNPLYNTTAVLDKMDRYPSLKMRRDGKYYLKMKDVVVEEHPKVKRNKRGDVIPTIKKESLGAIERIVSRFCEDVLCVSRAQFLPLSSQGERHLIWVGKKKANHIIRYLNGNGCYVVNRFPGDIFMKDKQVMGIILRDHMLMRSNHCYWKCGVPKEDILNPKKAGEDDEENPLTYRICRHMVKTMQVDEEGCEDKGCYNFEKHTCKHLDIFIPEVQSFCTYNALQDFSNRLEDDLKGQTFVCKPAYLYKGYGFRFFRTSAQFQEFYHMTEGKETSRHDFMVQRLVDKPFLFNNRKVDVRAFLLVVVLRYRRVVSFIHYGFCRVSNTDFELNEEEEELQIEEPLSDKEMEKKRAEEYEKDMRMFVCTYRTAEEKRDRAKRMETQTFFDEADDRSQELTAVFPKDEELVSVKEQIKHIGVRLSQAIENKVWDAFGCFQIFGLDLCVDEDMKVWLLEVNSHAMSNVDTLSQTQRKVVPSVIMEALGLVVETTYKSFHHLRLRKSPTNEFEETGFLFRQNYDFIFSTLAKKRMDYVWPKPPKKRDLPYFERIAVVDQQIKDVDRRKKACHAMKIAVREEQLALKRKRNAKDDEES